MLEFVARNHVDSAGGGKVALIREVRALGDLHTLYHLGNDEIGVGITLPVRMRDKINRDSVDGER